MLQTQGAQSPKLFGITPNILQETLRTTVSAELPAACTASGVVGGFWNSGLEGNIPKGFRFFVVDDDVAAMQETLAKNLVGFQEKRQKALAGLAK